MAGLDRTFGAGVARLLFEVAVSRGAEPEALAAQSGVSPRLFADQDARLPLSAYVALMRAGKKLSGDAALGLHFGAAAELSEFSVLGLIGSASATMRDGIAQLNRYSRLVVDVAAPASGRFVLESGMAGDFLIDARLDPNSFFELSESTFSRMVTTARRRGAAIASAVFFTHKDPGYRDEYERIFQMPVHFGGGRNALKLADGWLEQKLPAPQSRYAFGVLSRHANALLQRLEQDSTVSGRVERLAMPILHTGDCDIERVSALMGVSRWTLSRRLKEEGATFAGVLDALRRRMALGYLDDGKVSVSEIAYLTGFSEASAFSRAFKRWTGKSPRKARAKTSGK